jgi:hypothetical protein
MHTAETFLTLLGTGNALSTRCYNTCFTLHGNGGVLQSSVSVLPK